MLPDWTQELARLGCGVDDALDAIRRRLRRRSRTDSRLEILPYRGFGNDRELHLKGRVLIERPPSEASTSSLQNLLATYRRFHSQEVPHKEVRASLDGASVTATTDNEGFFEATLPNLCPLDQQPWRTVEFETEGGAKATGRVFIPSKSARFGVISDIDDTVLVSHATSLPRMLYTLLLKNSRGRVAFPGVAAFYRALEAGTQAEANPLFYVSSGPWNLYDLLIDFFELNRIPAGPLFLQDYGFERDRFLCASHQHHKRQQIERILKLHPNLPFILIGDSGQKDPEIYAQLLEEIPNRILAVYIRDVTETDRDEEVQRLSAQATIRGAELLLVHDSLEAARHAVARGWIDERSVPKIAEERTGDLNALEENCSYPPESRD
jgi:phosphatidate phosphatase APP1